MGICPVHKGTGQSLLIDPASTLVVSRRLFLDIYNASKTLVVKLGPGEMLCLYYAMGASSIIAVLSRIFVNKKRFADNVQQEQDK